MKLAYTAFDKGGKAISGTAEAASPAEARENLRRQGLFVTDIREASAGEISYATAKSAAGGSAGKRIGTGQRLRNLAMFSRQLHVLVSSGTPIVQALSAIERQCEHENWRLVVAELRKRVEEGTPLSEAMRQQSNHFDAVCRS